MTQFTNGADRVIAYASRAMAAPERNFTVTEQECLAVIWAVQKFRPCLEGYPFEAITVQSSLHWLDILKDPTVRLRRWATELLRNQITIKHRKGALHHVPDARCRMYETEVEVVNSITEADAPWYLRWIKNVQEMPSHFPDWKVEGGH